ncbi:MAG: shikimate kinase [Gemmatimonadales bacterium]|jgi:shikimate kinase
MMPTFRTSHPVSAADPSRPHIILVGLPGSGKTAVGQAVAERLGRGFIDLDLEIERREGRTVAELFAEKGEPYFRAKERELTQELAMVGNMIVSPGGGWISNGDVVSIVRPPSRLVYLKVRPKAALKRLGPGQASRPLLLRPDPLGELNRLLAARSAAYEAADDEVDTELFALQKVIERVSELASVVR